MKTKSSFINKLFKSKITLAAFIVLLIIVLTAIFGPGLCKYSPLEQDYDMLNSGVTKEHWLGTDYTGRDTFTRLVYGARHSLAVSVSGVLAGGVIGVFMGLIAGYYSGFADTLISRFVELLMAVPGILLAILTIAVMGKGNFNTVIAVALSVIASFTRITRSVVMGIKNTDYVKSCYIIGESDMRIILTHVLPNSLSLIIVNFTLNLGAALLTVSSLSFLGIGVQPPTPEWGAMIAAGKDYMRVYPLGILAPGLCITMFVICASIVGDGLRDALDPRI